MVAGGERKDIQEGAIADPESIFNSDRRTGRISDTEVSIREAQYYLRYSISDEPILSARVSLSPLIKGDNPFLLPDRILYGIGFSGEEIAISEWIFIEGSGIPTIVLGKSGTRLGWEGKGLGTALALLSNSLIEDVLNRHSSRFASKAVIGRILDSSRPVAPYGVDRRGWSSAIAEALGYTRIASSSRSPVFQKVFR